MSRRRVVFGSMAFALAAIVTVCIVLHPIDVTYGLWRLRNDPDPYLYIPELCDTGPDVVPHVYESFDKHGRRDDVEAFRVAVVHILRCVRRGMGPTGLEDNRYFDAPVDPKLVDVIVRAYQQEPRADRRASMFVFMKELDFRAWFAIYAGFSRGPHPIPYPHESIPSFDPYGRNRGLDAIRAEWCRVLAPLARELIDSGEYLNNEPRSNRGLDAVGELAEANCAADDMTRFTKVIADDVDHGFYARAVVRGLVTAIDSSPQAARDLLVPLLQEPHSCDVQHRVLLELDGTLSPQLAEVVSDNATDCARERMCRDSTDDCREHLVATLTRE